jgi:hypothetical protein
MTNFDLIMKLSQYPSQAEVTTRDSDGVFVPVTAVGFTGEHIDNGHEIYITGA